MLEKKLAIKLRKFDRVCPIKGNEENIRVGAPVVVLTNRGVEFGAIVSYARAYPQSKDQDVRLKKVMRYATQSDIDRAQELQQLETDALRLGYKKVQEFELPLKIVNVEYLFDRKKVHIYYKLKNEKSAPNIRDLRRDLAQALQAEVLMRSVTPRDEAKFLGGLGPCGQPLCCSKWLSKPRHITVKMVKDQGVQISPSRTSGMCGRLMCCFEYEHQGGSKPQPKEGKRNG